MEKDGPASSIRLYEAQLASLLKIAFDINLATDEVVFMAGKNPKDVDSKLDDISESLGRLVGTGLDLSNPEEGKFYRLEIVKVLSSVIMKSKQLTAATKTYVRNRAAVDVKIEHLSKAASDFKEAVDKLIDLCNALAASRESDDALHLLQGLNDNPPEEDETEALRNDSVLTHLMSDATSPSASDGLLEPDEEKLSPQVEELSLMLKEVHLKPTSPQQQATQQKSSSNDLEKQLKMVVVDACFKDVKFRRTLSIRGTLLFRVDESDVSNRVNFTETLFRDKIPGKRSTGDGAVSSGHPAVYESSVVSSVHKYFKIGETGTSEASDDDEDTDVASRTRTIETDVEKTTTSSPGLLPRFVSPSTRICSSSPPRSPVLTKAGKHVTFDLSGPSLSDDDGSDDEAATRNELFVFRGGNHDATESTSENRNVISCGSTNETSAPPPRIRSFFHAGSSPRDSSTGRDGRSEGGDPSGNCPPTTDFSNEFRAGGVTFTQTISFPATSNGLVLMQTISVDPPTPDA